MYFIVIEQVGRDRIFAAQINEEFMRMLTGVRYMFAHARINYNVGVGLVVYLLGVAEPLFQISSSPAHFSF